jgi:hypothetical protein
MDKNILWDEWNKSNSVVATEKAKKIENFPKRVQIIMDILNIYLSFAVQCA